MLTVKTTITRITILVYVLAISAIGMASTEVFADNSTENLRLPEEEQTLELVLDLGSEFGAEQCYIFQVDRPGIIDIYCKWEGSAKILAGILNGPVGGRIDQGSPIHMSYRVDEEHLKRSNDFKLSIVNFRGGEATGQLKLSYPSHPRSITLTQVNQTFVNRILSVPDHEWERIHTRFDSINASTIAKSSFSKEKINGSNDEGNQLTPGSIILCKTSEGRLSKFLIEQYGYNLDLSWVTYDPNGEIFSSGKNLRIHGTWSCDLDRGTEDSLKGDFWWQQVTEQERYLTPANGAEFTKIFGRLRSTLDSVSVNREIVPGTLSQCPYQRELDSEITNAQDTIKMYGRGHVIVGQVVLDGEGDVRDVRAQMEILADGYFAGPVADLSRPIGFRMHQYAPYDLRLKPTEKTDVIDVGTIHLKPSPKDHLENFTAKITLADGGDLSRAEILLSVMNGPVNTPSNGTSPRSYWPDPIAIPVQADGHVHAEGFSPIKYYCRIKAPDYLEQTRAVKFLPNQTLDLGTITLEKPQPIKLSYMVSKEPLFDLNSQKDIAIATGTRWRATDDIYGWDLEFKQKQGAIILDYSYGPCQIWDLGQGELAQFVNVGTKNNGNRPYKYQINSGHVYLVNQGHWQRWILLKVDTNESASKAIPES
ncbi:hypothetical protein ACFL6U_11345 [Planctomycetota bacterium]